MDHYASRRKDMLAIVNQLHSIGAQTYIELPRIVVIGNQSAGKSSVVEAISGITVPRDAGTCTRCPMECRLASSEDPWCCQISIRYEFEPNGGRRLKDVIERKFGDLIMKKSQVEPMLRRAQWAVLNPKLSYEHIFGMSMHEMDHNSSNSALRFSRNVVCVDLKGPGLTDLSFIDLPGIIQNAETETVKLVEDMVVSHIAGNCLILVALPMTDDVENQKALKLANVADPQGRRTIGVLTKPDMLPEGSVKNRALWLDVVEGRRFPLKHGYYCTRHPDDADRSQGMTSEEARKAEMEFFARMEPWNISIKPHYFGVKNLTAALSSLLIQVIQEALPKIQLEATRQLETCRDELEHLPKPIVGDPATYMLQLITALCDDVNLHVRGSPQTSKMIQDNRAAFAKFRVDIRKTAPNFVSSGKAKAPADDEESDEDGGVLTTSAPFTVSDMRKHIQRSVTRELPNNVPFDAKVVLITSFQHSWPSSVKSCFDAVRNTVLNTLLSCVDHERLGRYDLLTHHLRSFVSEIISEQYASCYKILEAILEVELSPFTQNLHYLDSSSEKWLAKYKGARQEKKSQPVPAPAPVQALKPAGLGFSPIPPKMSSGVLDSRPAPFNNNSDSSDESSQVPTFKPFKFGTKNRTNTSTPASASAPVIPIWDQRPSTSGTFLPAENILSSFASDKEKTDKALAALAALGFTGLTAEDLEKLHPVDEYETELKVMAEVRGYFQVSYKRIIDYVPSLIDLKFVKAVGKALQPFLIKKFELGSNEANVKCAKYLAEDPVVTAVREELGVKKRRLEKVQEELYRFGGL
ncbi:hypothetical protein ARMSODRAFT_947905 [Armillaria solidipes]|uniref:P-loop containing nucleoside triphosphate hydrolase protein n=1 Tax=Armillaria solidipes TaxID=1076256 RepID=A0A2H3C767_9AGAR|nr:hypothetical protein ARMSODRAFT_947905 [Armillaria solidipes]